MEDRFRLPLAQAPRLQERLLREFKRHLHRYSSDCPSEADELRWLALMQHHGAPTRLVDCTYSFFVGLFFAIEDAKPNDRVALWALDHDWLWDVAKKELPHTLVRQIQNDPSGGKGPESIAGLFQTPRQLVIPVNPLDLDERLAVQQGVFLTSLDLTRRLPAVIQDLGSATARALYVRKRTIRCSLAFLQEALSELQRMNITRLSLFPGVDGLAMSLGNLLAMPYRFLAESTWGEPGGSDRREWGG
jgi:hypothetical protein